MARPARNKLRGRRECILCLEGQLIVACQRDYRPFLKRHELRFRRQKSLGLSMTSTVRPRRGALHRYPGTSMCSAPCSIVLVVRSSLVPAHTVPYGTALLGGVFPGTSGQATIAPSLRDNSQ